MAPFPCLLLPHEDAGGPENMARDEAMLDFVTREPGCAAFRTYGWSEPTLSLGYFQMIGEVRSDPRWRDVPVVRRSTGGGAIWHHHELTYALAVPRGHPLARATGELYRAVHGAIAGLLAAAGADSQRRGDGELAGTRGRPFLCFTDRDAEDLVVGAAKIVGSSQRRRAGATLQHGSLMLLRSGTTRELAGVADLTPVSADPGFWAGRFREVIPQALRFVPVASGWPEGLSERARELELSVYRRSEWTGRR